MGYKELMGELWDKQRDPALAERYASLLAIEALKLAQATTETERLEHGRRIEHLSAMLASDVAIRYMEAAKTNAVIVETAVERFAVLVIRALLISVGAS